MQFLSFDPSDPVFRIDGWNLSFQVITLENVHGLWADSVRVRSDGPDHVIEAGRLAWGGQQHSSPGTLTARARVERGGRLRLEVEATAPRRIRALKILVRDLPPLTVPDQLDRDRPLPEAGLLERYPNPLRIPVLPVRLADGSGLGFRCEDPEMRAKRFAAYQERFPPRRHVVECIHEEDARLFDTSIRVPPWILARSVAPGAFRDEQLAFNESRCGLLPWEKRTDVPGWARRLRLVLTLHGMHWTGYVFNTYDRMLEILRRVACHIDGGSVLAYLPGWEGRYYWQYGDFRPEPLLGGEEGFARLCEGARSLGVHVMPMFGGNCANAWAPGFHAFGPPSVMKSATRNVFLGNQPDWDTSRAHDTGWQAWLNPGAPAWQRELSGQILRLADRFGFDAVFLDTVEVWANDPDFNLREGWRELVDRLRAGRPELLVAGEDWYDGLLPIFPLFQQTSKWRPVPDWAGRYVRLMGHICDGEPGRGSTGVFESGHAPYERLPDRPHYLPTLAFVDGTLEDAAGEIEAVVALAAGRAGGPLPPPTARRAPR